MTVTTKQPKTGARYYTSTVYFFTSLDFKLRRSIIRLAMGQHKLEKLTDRYNKNLLNTAVETVYDSLQKCVGDTMSASLAKCPKDTLSQIIAKNEFLTEIQKAQIASIIETPSHRDGSQAYLG